MLTEGGSTPEERIDVRLPAGRRPPSRRGGAAHRSCAGWSGTGRPTRPTARRPRQLVRLGESPVADGLDPAELAAYTATASVILNLDETITKE